MQFTNIYTRLIFSNSFSFCPEEPKTIPEIMMLTAKNIKHRRSKRSRALQRCLKMNRRSRKYVRSLPDSKRIKKRLMVLINKMCKSTHPKLKIEYLDESDQEITNSSYLQQIELVKDKKINPCNARFIKLPSAVLILCFHTIMTKLLNTQPKDQLELLLCNTIHVFLEKILKPVIKGTNLKVEQCAVELQSAKTEYFLIPLALPVNTQTCEDSNKNVTETTEQKEIMLTPLKVLPCTPIKIKKARFKYSIDDICRKQMSYSMLLNRLATRQNSDGGIVSKKDKLQKSYLIKVSADATVEKHNKMVIKKLEHKPFVSGLENSIGDTSIPNNEKANKKEPKTAIYVYKQSTSMFGKFKAVISGIFCCSSEY